MKEKIFKFVVVFAFILCCWVYLWNIGFYCFIPWTRTHFTNYDSYIKLLDKRSFYASRQFIDEIPKGASSVKYYCHQVFKNRIVAHSIVLDENIYLRIVENQKEGYQNFSESKARKLIYVMNKEECWSVSDLKQLGFDESFLRNVMFDLEVQQDYYCVVVITINTTRGICYTGVIANDSTHEMIEFSVEVPDGPVSRFSTN